MIHGRYRLAIRQELSRVLPDQLAITLEAPPKYEQRGQFACLRTATIEIGASRMSSVSWKGRMTEAKNRQIILVSRPHGEPKLENFRLAEAPIPAIGPGQVLLKTKFLSLDPYMRGRMNAAKSMSPRLPSASPLAAKRLARSSLRIIPNPLRAIWCSPLAAGRTIRSQTAAI